MTASATTMIRIAPQKPSAVWTVRSPVLLVAPVSVCTISRYAIHTSSSPPAAASPGMLSSQTTASVIATRTAIAPAVPQRMTRRCICLGTLRAASAIMIALSPASMRSITMIAPRAERNETKSGDSSSMQFP